MIASTWGYDGDGDGDGDGDDDGDGAGDDDGDDDSLHLERVWGKEDEQRQDVVRVATNVGD